jgi:hypothetical protein
MAAVDDLDRVLEQWHLAQDAFVKGDPEPVKEMWSHGEDVSVANPYGPPSTGVHPQGYTITLGAPFSPTRGFLDSPGRCIMRQ